MKEDQYIKVLSTPCLVTDSADLTRRVTQRCREPGACSIDFTNVHIVAMRKADEEFRAETSEVDWFVPDSQILTWAVTWLGGERNERVYGPAFLDYFIRNADLDLTHYFLGASQECLDLLLEKSREKRPGLKIVGSHNGYFKESDEDFINREINELKPDIIWVGLGTPKQQSWVNRNKKQLNGGAMLAVGFAFDVNAGTKSDAPDWMGRCGVLWLYRFVCEPRRLFKRYAVYNSIFVWHLIRQVMGKS